MFIYSDLLSIIGKYISDNWLKNINHIYLSKHINTTKYIYFNEEIYENLELFRFILGAFDPGEHIDKIISYICFKGYNDLLFEIMKDSSVLTPWHLVVACTYGHYDIVDTLLYFNVDPAHFDNLALLCAVKGKHIEVIKLLLDTKKVDTFAKQGIIISEAIMGGNLEIVKLIFKYKDFPKEFLLFKIALKYKKYQIFCYLMEKYKIEIDWVNKLLKVDFPIDLKAYKYLLELKEKLENKQEKKENNLLDHNKNYSDDCCHTCIDCRGDFGESSESESDYEDLGFMKDY